MTQKISRLIVRVVLALALVISAFLLILNFAKAQPSKNADLVGLVDTSGTVTSPSEFKAAKVYFRNPGKRMLYMVYTSGGKYQVMNLMPGSYEVSVEAKGLESDVRKLELKPGVKMTINLSLHNAPNDSANVRLLPYDDIYPKGSEGRKIVERLCVRCHGPNFLPSKQWDADQWNGAIDFMSGNGNPQGAQIQPGDLTKEQRQVLVKFLVDNFGPASQARAVKFQTEMPVDETKISKAEYIEYYLPVDGPGAGINAPEYASAPRPGPFGKRRVDQDIVFDQQGAVWVTDRGIPNRIARLNPRTGDYQDFVVPAPTKGIHDLMIDDHGKIWVPEESGPNVDVFDTQTLKWVAAYPMDPDHVIPGMKNAQSLVIDSKDNVYMNFIVGNGMSRLDWQTKKATVTTLPTPNSFPYGVVKDSRDNVWIAEFHGSKIAKLDAETQKYTEYTPPTYPALIRRLTVDSKGDVWFGLFSAGKLERLDPNSGKITEWVIPFENSEPYDEKQDRRSDKIWFSDGGQGGALILFDSNKATFTIYPSPQRTDMPMIRIANDGAVWYAPRSAKNAGIGVLYPDMTKIATLAAYGTND
jgi:streptogramin lyase